MPAKYISDICGRHGLRWILMRLFTNLRELFCVRPSSANYEQINCDDCFRFRCFFGSVEFQLTYVLSRHNR